MANDPKPTTAPHSGPVQTTAPGTHTVSTPATAGAAKAPAGARPRGGSKTQPESFGAPELTDADIEAGVTVEAVDLAAEVANVHLNTPSPSTADPAKVSGPVLSGVDAANVRTADGGVALVNRGEALPEDAQPESVKRLESLGYIDKA